MNDRKTLALVAVIIGVTSWGFGGVFVKLASVRGLALAFYRLWIGFAVMAVALKARGGRLNRAGLRHSGLAGVMFGLNVAFFFSAVKITSVTDATLIAALQPVLVLLVAGRWFGESISRREVIWTLVSVAGVGVVVIGGSGTPVWSAAGDLLAVGAVVTFTAYFLIAKHAHSTVGPLEFMTGVMLTSGLVITPLALISGQSLTAVKAGDWFWIGLFVLVPGAIGHVLVTWAHRYVDVYISSLMTLAIPVVAAVSAVIILDEPLAPLQITGGVVVMLAIGAVLATGTRKARGDLPVTLGAEEGVLAVDPHGVPDLKPAR